MALPEGWEQAIPEVVWPTAMVAAIRRDLSALGSSRVLETLRTWQRELSSDRAPIRAEAARWLGLVADALRAPLPVPHESMDGEDETVALHPDEDTSPTAVAYRTEVPALDPTPPPALVLKKPRAAGPQVLSLYGTIAPFCRELVPLSPARRARRFWSLWREVSGDRGVHREPVDQLLARPDLDFRTLVVGLIAEVQGVDAESVRAVIEKVEDSGTRPVLDRKNRERADRVTRGPSVRVTGIDPGED
jgi:hypothetical protein